MNIKSWKTMKWISFAIFLTGAGTIAYRSAYRESHSTVALKKNVTISKGKIIESQFRTDFSDDYIIYIDVDRVFDTQKTDCLLGGDPMEPQKCAEIPSKLSVSWEVSSEGKSVAQGQMEKKGPSYWGPTIGAEVGSFTAREDENYTLSITSSNDFQELSAAHPKIIIELATASLLAENGMAIYALAYLFILVGGLSSLLFWYVEDKKKTALLKKD